MLATKYPDRVHSILMLAPAVNHGLDDDLFETLMQSLDPEVGGLWHPGTGRRRLLVCFQSVVRLLEGSVRVTNISHV